MERAVEVGAGIGDEIDATDLEGGSGRVATARVLPTQVIADVGRGEAGIGNHPVLDDVAQIDEHQRSSSGTRWLTLQRSSYGIVPACARSLPPEVPGPRARRPSPHEPRDAP